MHNGFPDITEELDCPRPEVDGLSQQVFEKMRARFAFYSNLTRVALEFGISVELKNDKVM